MARFKLGNRIASERHLPWRPETSYPLCEDLLRGYEKQGFTVVFQDERPPEHLSAELKKGDGTRLIAAVDLEREEGGCGLRIQLTGTVVVSGAKGMFATDSLVRKTALERLESYLSTEIRRQASLIPEDGAQESEETDGAIEVVEESSRAETIAVAPEPLVEAEASSQANAVPEPAESAPAKAKEQGEPLRAGSVEYRLEVLKLMLDRGLIDAADFNQKKKGILLSL